jgi:release factor glutamine methyltransferase
LLVEEALRIAESYYSRSLTIVDVGTGSGAIALALAKHLADAKIIATDISQDAIALAKRNAERLGLAHAVGWAVTDLIAGLKGPFDLIVANLPYVKTSEWSELSPEIRLYEPRRAFDGGADGLDPIRRLLSQSPDRLAQNGAILLEIAWDQAQPLYADVAKLLPNSRLRIKQDLAGLDRLAIIDSL